MNDNDTWRDSETPEDSEKWKPQPEGASGDESPTGSPPGFDDLDKRIKEINAREAAERRARKASGEDYNAFIKKRAAWSWTRDGLEYTLCKHPADGHWCGYVRFPARPVRAERYEGILTYVPVHGGITWAEDSPDGTFVYGFDCAHAHDRINRCKGSDPDWFMKDLERRMKRARRTGNEKHLLGPFRHRPLKWLRANMESMVVGIKVAARYEDAYLAATTPSERATVLDNFHRYLRKEMELHFDITESFGAMMGLLTGQL